MKIYTIKGNPSYRIIEESGLFYTQKLKKISFIKWWGYIYEHRYTGLEKVVRWSLADARKFVDMHMKCGKIESTTIEIE